jgi:hypothetical protein
MNSEYIRDRDSQSTKPNNSTKTNGNTTYYMYGASSKRSKVQKSNRKVDTPNTQIQYIRFYYNPWNIY